MVTPLRRARAAAVRTGFRVLNEIVTPPLRSGFAAPPPVGQGVGAVVLETTGRRSGLPREVPLMAVRVGDRLAVSTVRPNADWLKNLEATPEGRIWLCGGPQTVNAVVHRGSLNVAFLEPVP